ncbi:MAG: YVTN family beta-propeller protein [Natronomonas sp.]
MTAEIDRTPEGGRGDRGGPGPCDVTIHPDGEYAYVPDLFGDTLTVLSVEPFEIVTQVDVEPVGDGSARPWMGTVAADGQTLLVEHNEANGGSESIWTLDDPAAPSETGRLTVEDGLGRRPLTSQIGPDSETGYVFTPGSNDVSVVDLTDGTVTTRLDLGGSAFVGTWDPARTKLYVPVQTADEVAVIDHERREVVTRIYVGPSPYGATSAQVRPQSDSSASMALDWLNSASRPSNLRRPTVSGTARAAIDCEGTYDSRVCRATRDFCYSTETPHIWRQIPQCSTSTKSSWSAAAPLE